MLLETTSNRIYQKALDTEVMKMGVQAMKNAALLPE